MSHLSTLVICLWFVTLLIARNEVAANLCKVLKSQCQCVEHVEEVNNVRSDGIRVECTHTTANALHHDIDRIYNYFNRSKPIHALQVRDSNLRGLPGLPSGLVDVKHLMLDNTGVDLEQIRESNELLIALKSFRVYRENFTEVPEKFFEGFHDLSILELNKIGINALSEDGFSYLEDTLKELRLRDNKLRSIPISISTLNNLEMLDLENNEITNVSDDLSANLESGLRSLNKLIMNSKLGDINAN